MNPSPSDKPGINLPPSAISPADDASTTQSATPPVSDDHDSIEKEWVGKVKAIVGRTHDDPYRRSKELTVLKAEYLKQRYNKIIKVDT